MTAPSERKLATRLQPKLAPKAPETRKEAAKEAFLDALYEVKSLVREVYDDFRASDRFFKYKAAVIVGWAVLCGFALFVACPSYGPEESSNSLDARVLVRSVPAPDRAITALYIENESGKDWGDTLLRLNNTFTHALAGLKAGSSAVVTLDKFSGPGGRAPSADLKPQELEIRCDRGRTSIDLSELAP